MGRGAGDWRFPQRTNPFPPGRPPQREQQRTLQRAVLALSPEGRAKRQALNSWVAMVEKRAALVRALRLSRHERFKHAARDLRTGRVEAVVELGLRATVATDGYASTRRHYVAALERDEPRVHGRVRVAAVLRLGESPRRLPRKWS